VTEIFSALPILENDALHLESNTLTFILRPKGVEKNELSFS